MNISFEQKKFPGEWNFIWASDFMKLLARCVKWNLILNEAPVEITRKISFLSMKMLKFNTKISDLRFCSEARRGISPSHCLMLPFKIHRS